MLEGPVPPGPSKSGLHLIEDEKDAVLVCEPPQVLEEPPLNTVFVLVSDQPRRLLPTIRSRCTRLDVGLPAAESALHE